MPNSLLAADRHSVHAPKDLGTYRPKYVAAWSGCIACHNVYVNTFHKGDCEEFESHIIPRAGCEQDDVNVEAFESQGDDVEGLMRLGGGRF